MGLVGVRLTDQLGNPVAIYEVYLATKKLSLNDPLRLGRTLTLRLVQHLLMFD